LTLADRIFGQPSARVVAVARIALAGCFFFATLADPRAGQSPLVDPLLGAFLAFALIVAGLTWSNWWVDARIAIATHLIDIIFFMVLLFVPGGYSSPYFLFFVFLLLSSAIRWEWKETALTAVAVVALYIVAGLTLGNSGQTPFELRRFIIRSGYLFVLSAVLVWFGVRRRFQPGILIADGALGSPVTDDPPLVAAIRMAGSVVRASHTGVAWNYPDGREEVLVGAGGEWRRLGNATLVPRTEGDCFLFDLRRNRALIDLHTGRPIFTTADSMVPAGPLREAIEGPGLAVRVESDLGRGLFMFWGVPDLHGDHLQLGERLSSEIAHLIGRRALLSALHEGVIARERLGLARDLHDGIVQFLAGSTYTIEAISQSSASGAAVVDALQELKQLMLLEQEDLRSSIGALRKDKVSFVESAAQAEALCERLSQHWRTNVSFATVEAGGSISTRVHMDLLQIIKEGVANAVRHASAQNIEVRLTQRDNSVELIVRNDGRPRPELAHAPWSIQERARDANGTLSVGSKDGSTTVVIVLPITDDPA
jgi:signal transduction histidine kinase